MARTTEPFDFDWDHHTPEECQAAWGMTCWRCDPEHHRKPDYSVRFTLVDVDPKVIDLLFGRRIG